MKYPHLSTFAPLRRFGWFGRIVRRLFFCFFGWHWHNRWDDSTKGIAGSAQCLDCGKIWPAVKWLRK